MFSVFAFGPILILPFFPHSRHTPQGTRAHERRRLHLDRPEKGGSGASITHRQSSGGSSSRKRSMCYVQQAKEKEAAAAAAAAAAGGATSDRVLRSRPVVMAAEGKKQRQQQQQEGRREGGEMRVTGVGEGRSPRGGVGGAGGRDGEEEEVVEEEEKTVSFMTQKKVIIFKLLQSKWQFGKGREQMGSECVTLPIQFGIETVSYSLHFLPFISCVYSPPHNATFF